MSIPEEFITDWPDGPYWHTVDIDDDKPRNLVLIKEQQFDALIRELARSRQVLRLMDKDGNDEGRCLYCKEPREDGVCSDGCELVLLRGARQHAD